MIEWDRFKSRFKCSSEISGIASKTVCEFGHFDTSKQRVCLKSFRKQPSIKPGLVIVAVFVSTSSLSKLEQKLWKYKERRVVTMKTFCTRHPSSTYFLILFVRSSSFSSAFAVKRFNLFTNHFQNFYPPPSSCHFRLQLLQSRLKLLNS